MSTRQEFHSGLARSKATSKRDCGIVFATNFSILFSFQNIQEYILSLQLLEPMPVKTEKIVVFKL